jgi:hypothetical protein
MTAFNRFYNTVAGKVIIDMLIGLLVGYFIYLWRGNGRAPWMCAVAMGALAFFKAKGYWPRR